MASKQVVIWKLPGLQDTRMEVAEILGHLFPKAMGVSIIRR
jgi:hypothetical protein